MKFLILFMLVITRLVLSEDFIDFIKPCSLSDEKLNQCLLENGNHALPHLINGDKKLNIRPFHPYWHIPKLGGKLNDNFKYILSNVRIVNFEKIKLVDASYNKTDNSVTFKTHIPYATLHANYDIDLDISGNHFQGNDKASALIDNITYVFKVYIRSGTGQYVDHYEVDKVDFDYTADKVTFEFQYLAINGYTDDEKTNTFINENWTVFMALVHPSWKEFLVNFTHHLFDKIFSAVPKDRIFLP